jgi:hypothetical protein
LVRLIRRGLARPDAESLSSARRVRISSDSVADILELALRRPALEGHEGRRAVGPALVRTEPGTSGHSGITGSSVAATSAATFGQLMPGDRLMSC